MRDGFILEIRVSGFLLKEVQNWKMSEEINYGEVGGGDWVSISWVRLNGAGEVQESPIPSGYVKCAWFCQYHAEQH